MMLLRCAFVSGRRGSSTTSVQCSSRNINFSNHIQETARMFRTTRILYSTAHFQASDRWSPGAWRMAAALLLMLNALVATSGQRSWIFRTFRHRPSPLPTAHTGTGRTAREASPVALAVPLSTTVITWAGNRGPAGRTRTSITLTRPRSWIPTRIPGTSTRRLPEPVSAAARITPSPTAAPVRKTP